MSNLSQAVNRFEDWFKKSGMGVCKNPDLTTAEERQALKEKRMQDVIAKSKQQSPIYTNSKRKGD